LSSIPRRLVTDEEDVVERGPLIRDASLMEAEDWQIVRSTPLFGTMPKEVTVRLVGSSGPKIYEKGALLFQQGDPANAFYVILDGWVKIARLTPEGGEAVVGMFRRGETFAEAAMFLGGRYPANAEVVTPSRLLKIDGDNLRRNIRENSDLALCMLASASHHLKFLVEQIEQIKLLSAPQRIADFLIQQCRTRCGSCVVVLPYEKALIASRLGMKPESFSRAIGRLRKLGVSVDHEFVSISDVGTLIAFVEKSIESYDES
jgi:CRP-like cAMP-binding protein